MPTTRRRIMLTVSDELEAALARGAAAWPEEASDSKVLLRLVECGCAHLDEEDEREALRRRREEAMRRILDGGGIHYPPDYLKELREEWPE